MFTAIQINKYCDLRIKRSPDTFKTLTGALDISKVVASFLFDHGMEGYPEDVRLSLEQDIVKWYNGWVEKTKFNNVENGNLTDIRMYLQKLLKGESL